MRKTMKKLTQGATRLLVLALGLGLVSTVWAAASTPTAVWESGQFADAAGSHGGYSITLPTGASIVNGNIVLTGSAATGALIDVASVDANKTSVSVLIKYSGVTAPSKACSFVSTHVAGSTSFDMHAISVGASLSLKGQYNNTKHESDYAFSSPAPTLTASGYFLFTYNSSGGTSGYAGSAPDCLSGGKNTDLKFGSRTISKIGIGGPTGSAASTYPTWDTGVTIEAIAIFVGQELTKDTISEYTFPSADPLADYDYVATISANTTFSDITTWTKGTGTPGAGSKVYIASENNAVLTISGALSLERLRMFGGSITLANGASVSSTQIDGADINIASSTEVSISDSDILSKITCNGTLNTAGTTILRAENEFTSTSTLNVGGTKTTLNAGQKKLSGNITIAANAELENLRGSDSLNYDATLQVDVYGTLNMGNTRWTLKPSNTINLYAGGEISGNGQGSYGALDAASALTINVKGTSTISAKLRTRSNLTLKVESGTLTYSGATSDEYPSNQLIKTGAGTIESSATPKCIWTVNEGNVIQTVFPAYGVTIAEGATFTLKDIAWTSNADRFSGSGTLELLSTTANRTHTVTGSSFAGIVKLSNQDDKQCNLNPSGAATFTVAPELVLNANVVHLGDNYYRQQSATHGPLELRDLSGSGLFYAVWSSDAEYEYLVRTKQTKNTRFSGYIYSNTASNGNRRWINLDVVGDGSGTVNSLTMDYGLWLQTATDTSEQASTLSISNDAKVVFGSSGTWATGKVIVGEDGWLQSTNNAAVKNLTLQDGANLVFPTASSSLTGITNLTFTSGTTTISIPENVKHSNGTLIDWSAVGSAPAGTFQLDTDTASKYFISADASGLSITAAAARVGDTPYSAVDSAIEYLASHRDATVVVLDDTWEETDSQYYNVLGTMGILWNGTSRTYSYAEAYVGTPPVYHPTIADALSAAASGEAKTVYLYKNLAADPVLPAGVSLNLGNYTLTGSVTAADGNVVGQAIVDGKTVYTSYANSVGETWTDGSGDHSWGNYANWSLGFVPVDTTAVTFNDGATVTLDATRTVAGIVVNGAVSIGASQKSLNTSGNITGSGTLTLSDVCLASADAGITVAPTVNFTNDSELAGDNALTFNGDVVISDMFKVWNSNHVIAGDVTINSGVTFKYGSLLTINGAATVKGAFTRDAGSLSCIKFSGAVTIENGNVSIDGWQSGNLGDAATVVLAGANASLTDTRGIPIADNKVSTTVADSYVKKTGSTFAVAAKTVVTVSLGANVSLTIDGNSVADGDTLKFAPGDTFTYVATPAANYTATVTVTGGTDSDGTVTVGETAITVAATATRDAVSVSNVAFAYGNDYATADVTATVSDPTATYKMTVGVNEYTGVVSGTTVTFSDVVTGHSSAYDSVSYEITATDGTSSVVVSGGSGAAPVADVTADWINERAASATGTSASASDAGGAWTNAVTYTDGTAAISDNRFEATTPSTASRVVLEFNVCFSSTSEEDVSGEAQAAIKLGEENDATTFKVLTTGNTWMPVSRAGFTPDASATYNVVLTIDYGTGTYKVDIAGNSMTNSTGSASFPLAASRTSVQTIDFAGSGTLTSLKGSQFEGYMVKDALNNFYATIQAATQAYSSANGPYTVLHDGTAPSGWKIDEATKNLIKVAKGLFFMAY